MHINVGFAITQWPFIEIDFAGIMRVLERWSSFVVALFAVVQLAQATVLVNFQVAQPPPVPKTAKQCTVQVLK